MTMPSHEESWQLAEIARNLIDFRHEFRNFVNEVVRKDVYSANMASIQMQLDSISKENKRLEEEMERERQEKVADRRETRKALVTAALSVAVAVIVLIMEIVIK